MVVSVTLKQSIDTRMEIDVRQARRPSGLKDVGSFQAHVRYRGTSLIRNSAPPGPYSMNMSRALWWSYGEGLFLMSEVPLY